MVMQKLVLRIAENSAENAGVSSDVSWKSRPEAESAKPPRTTETMRVTGVPVNSTAVLISSSRYLLLRRLDFEWSFR
jgi:hypothetical protein